jgi:hypothetical protein
MNPFHNGLLTTTFKHEHFQAESEWHPTRLISVPVMLE